MASGMDTPTASGIDTSCGDVCCTFWWDDAGLRDPSKSCHVYGDPNFGTIDFNFEKRVFTMRIVGGYRQCSDGSGWVTTASGCIHGHV
jgi:hypothetical protein